METIKELEKGCGKFKLGKEETCRKEDLCLECQTKIQTLKDVLELIEKAKSFEGDVLLMLQKEIMGVNPILNEEKGVNR